MRQYSFIDHLLVEADKALRTVLTRPPTSRGNPGESVGSAAELAHHEREFAGRLMRINHAGEVAAQGLYQGQALTARDRNVQQQMERCSQEENEHLAWCDQRIEELQTHRSYFGPLWYCGAYAIGALAGLAGDRWSLGFVQETERQVVAHLDGHLQRLPDADQKSRAIVEQMKVDEAGHAYAAGRAGAAELPTPVKHLMKLASKVMTKTAYWL